ncbi:uncharacterized protein [Palaemon carinicauda]|uniref:uncharacterized protein n=1 Tax=Palaemon carinicauda TaxID=392227 RepID=UPI0035B5A967
MYLDDGIGIGCDVQETRSMAESVREDLRLSGFVINDRKSVWSPVQNLVWLGFCIDTMRLVLKVPEKRLKKVRDTGLEIMGDCVKFRKVFVRKVASFVGQIISMSTVIGSVSQLMTRCLSVDILNLRSWNDHIVLSNDSYGQIQFWLDNIDAINIRQLKCQPSCVKFVFSDASGHAFGGYVVNSRHGISHGMWSSEEIGKSSTWRELVAVHRVLIFLNHEVEGKRVKWFTDNKNIVSIISKGSMKVDLQNISLDIYRHCLVNSIHLEMEWISRSLNEKADFISQLRDSDDWGVSLQIFNYISELWGSFEIDWFASDSNHKLDKFYSRYWNMKCSGIDAFTESWANIRGWFCPSICLAYENDVAILPESVKENIERIPELLAEWRASSTTKVYYQSYMKWVTWLEKNGIHDKKSTMKPLVICMYLASLIQEGVSVSVLSSALYGIRWEYSVIGISSPTDSDLVKNVYEAGKDVCLYR